MKYRFLLLSGLAVLLTCGFSSGHNILVIAHRGGSYNAPENTLAAFRKAMEMGADMIEIDVEQTKDSVVIVMHDKTVDRTTDGSGPVDSLRYRYIKTLDAGNWFDKRFKGEKVPTLDEVLKLIDGKVKLLIEIKDGSERYPGIERRTVKAVRQYRACSWVIVQSFNIKAIERVKALDPEIKTFYLLGRNFKIFYQTFMENKSRPDPPVFDFDGIAAHYSVLDAASVNNIKQSGLGIFCWTVDDIATMKKMMDAGVDGVITDAPDRLITLIKSENE
ncbi:MAG: glycerophosphodiester phosphodiesterase [Chlorobi bacterium]|nr:glycerophosphodiester phosphodiesterase [Chlorobiota bacterium]